MPCGIKRVNGCHRQCLHRALVENYRDAHFAWEAGREQGEAMQMEDEDYAAMYPQPLFKQWLQSDLWAGANVAPPELQESA